MQNPEDPIDTRTPQERQKEEDNWRFVNEDRARVGQRKLDPIGESISPDERETGDALPSVPKTITSTPDIPMHPRGTMKNGKPLVTKDGGIFRIGGSGLDDAVSGSSDEPDQGLTSQDLDETAE